MWGCTVARRLAEAGRKVLVLEKRAGIGGNCRCEIDPETGIEVHTYGSHIFHTKNEKVWAFVNRFTQFNDYRHCVLARTHACGRRRKEVDSAYTYHLPIGCTLLKEFFGREVKPSELTAEEKNAIFEAFIRGYTSKQWGVPPENVDPSVIARLKVRDNDSTDYFNDPHQGIPLEGYNKLFERMLDHPNIEVRCNSPFVLNPTIQQSNNLTIYYSGPIDALFDYKFGALPWRTLRFETERLNCADYQGNSVVNYPDIDVPYTRIHEFRHYHPEWELEKRVGVGGGVGGKAGGGTIVMREYSGAWKRGDEPYYPIQNAESAALLKKYQDELARFYQTIKQSNNPTILCGGRLGGYRYYDMDQAIAAALELQI